MCRRTAMLAAALLVGIEYAAYWSLAPPRPSADDRFEIDLPGGYAANVVGQRPPWQLAYGVAVVVGVYVAKSAIVFRCREAGTALLQYGLVVMFSLPVLWVFVTTDWNNAHAELAYWFTLPVGLLAIPTAGFLMDLAYRPYRSLRIYALKTAVEIAVIPVAFYFWILAELMLGFYWI